MGGRGASSGRSVKGKAYGTEYSTVYQSGNIKFIRKNENSSINTPMETMTNGRIYVTLGKNSKPKSFTYYDKNNKRMKQVDITGREHKVNGEYIIPHTHKGYLHDERGTRNLSPKESKMLERIKKTWDKKLK